MINNSDFIKRLEILLEYYSLSASGFADKIGVQRSSLCHLLSGRNKPSLDFILKITEVFAEVDLYWILNGEGKLLKSENTSNTIPKIEIKNEPTPTSYQNIKDSNLFSENTISENPIFEKENKIFENTAISSRIKIPSEIERIVIFYKNGQFSEHLPK